MENKKNVNTSKYAGMSADEVLAQALKVTDENIANSKEPTASKVAPEVSSKLPNSPVTPPMLIQPLSTRDTTKLTKVNELFARREIKNATFHINGHAISIRLNGEYDALIKAIGLATNLVIDSGDNYIFAPNQRVIGELVFIREVADLDLEFLIRPEIRISQLIETYDILVPLIRYIESINDPDFQAYRDWYIGELTKSIDAAITYQNSAKGIVDALSAHNIKNQETMTEQIAELDSNKLSTVIDFMSRVEPKK